MNEWCKKTPLEWQALLHKELKVCAHEKQQHQGWLFTVDPVSAKAHVDFHYWCSRRVTAGVYCYKLFKMEE
uniref:Gem-associated protein 6 Sm-like domain-containing protein n=1 Tax=Erpetoichthys calabaricus TaxID=27687 RepID=A0A8C4TLY2_ERPCA